MLLKNFLHSIQDLVKTRSASLIRFAYDFPIAIPTIKDGGNHTPGFEKAAATIEAHNACLDVTKALAATGIRVLIDDEFMARVSIRFSDVLYLVIDASPRSRKPLKRIRKPGTFSFKHNKDLQGLVTVRGSAMHVSPRTLYYIVPQTTQLSQL